METMIIDGKEFDVFNETLPRANNSLFQYNPKKEVPEVGKWYEFDCMGNMHRYAKVVEIIGNYESVKNVPQVHGKKNINDFNLWVDFLASKGYSNFWQDLNAKDYGVAQSRKRCFMVSILSNAGYEFPMPVKLNKCMKDYLEDEVDEKYYIKSEKTHKLILDLQERGILEDKEKVTCDMTIGSPREISVMNCIKARYDQGISNIPCSGGGVIEKVKQLGNFTESKRNNPNTNRVYDEKGLSPTLSTMQGGNSQPMIVDNMLLMGYRVRKLTPCECWRLMGFSDEDFNKAAAVNSNSQLYKQAGNSIVKDVLMAIFRQMI